MSEQDQQSPPPETGERTVEVETGPLLPRWLSVSLYGVFIPWCIFASAWLGRNMVVQSNIWAALDLVGGPWDGEMPSMEDPAVQGGLETFRSNPRKGFLFIIQELRQDERKDPRRVRAIVLRKVVRWGTESRRRQLFEELLANMTETGDVRRDYALPPPHRDTLEDLLSERRAHPTTSYEENKITEVLQWVADGWTTPAVGPEKRRVKSLQIAYAKRLFRSRETGALDTLGQEWKESGDPLKEGAAEEFGKMLRGEYAELTAEQEELCFAHARHWDEFYVTGRERLAQVLRELVGLVAEREVRLDHSQIWDLVRLLDMPGDGLRREVAQAVRALKSRKFVLYYLADFIRTDAINPVMAVETPYLTTSEHENVLWDELRRRRAGALDVLHDIALQYCREPFPIRGVPAERQEEFFKDKAIRTLRLVREDEDVGARARSVIEEVEKIRPEYLQ